MSIEYPQDLFNAAKAILPRSYAPYSHYHVASALRDEQGQIHVGCNVENAAYGQTLCAEANAIGTMVSGGGQQIKALLLMVEDVVTSPCGGCRQRIAEFTTPDTIVYMCNRAGDVTQATIAELLPLAFKL